MLMADTCRRSPGKAYPVGLLLLLNTLLESHHLLQELLHQALVFFFSLLQGLVVALLETLHLLLVHLCCLPQISCVSLQLEKRRSLYETQSFIEMCQFCALSFGLLRAVTWQQGKTWDQYQTGRGTGKSRACCRQTCFCKSSVQS